MLAYHPFACRIGNIFFAVLFSKSIRYIKNVKPHDIFKWYVFGDLGKVYAKWFLPIGVKKVAICHKEIGSFPGMAPIFLKLKNN